jgi:hypothetical protein
MGTFTEIYVCANIKAEDDIVISALRYLLGEHIPSTFPDHPLFKCDHLEGMLDMCSSYIVPVSAGILGYARDVEVWTLLARADIKNYDGRIEKFFDWIRPHVKSHRDGVEYMGHSRVEDGDTISMYFSDGTAVVIPYPPNPEN